ncbi:MAG: aldo/keto reductase, partial [Alicyclobacillus sp.]|nr:aldo/keto reductase [Alicyclobacillus sp.]
MKAQIPTITLSDGLSVPVMGLGTFSLRGQEGVRAIQAAIEMGYRLLDTAYNYENEGTVGEAVRRSSVPREALCITSKLPGRYHTYDKAITAIQESLYRANLEYYDLYLIHWPNPRQNLYVEAWQALIEAKRRGWVRSVGVSNFLPEHLQRLVQETGVKPSINQVELHPFFQQADLRAWHQAHGIQT